MRELKVETRSPCFRVLESENGFPCGTCSQLRLQRRFLPAR